MPAEVKEQLHCSPVKFIAVGNMADRSRHRVLANSWHLGVIKFLMAINFSNLPTATTHPAAPPAQSAIQVCCDLSMVEAHGMGPLQWNWDDTIMRPAHSELDHWQGFFQAINPAFADPQAERGALQAANKLRHMIGDIPRLRQEVVSELSCMSEDWDSRTLQWMSTLPTHVMQVYHSSNASMVQVPVFRHFLRLCGYADVENPTEDMTWGFHVVGPMRQTRMASTT